MYDTHTYKLSIIKDKQKLPHIHWLNTMHEQSQQQNRTLRTTMPQQPRQHAVPTSEALRTTQKEYGKSAEYYELKATAIYLSNL